MTAKDIIKRLKAHHPAREWAFFAELRVGTGYKISAGYKNNPEQRFDAWAINLWPSRKFVRIAYEVKISRADFLREVHDPEKRQQAMEFSNQFYFVTPEGLVETTEIPDGCGLMEVPEKGAPKTVKTAPWRTGREPSWRFAASICRRLQKEEVRRA